MTAALLAEQLFNGVQLGLMLFLMAAGATLVFGVMRLINLAHGSLFMLSGYLAVAAFGWTGSHAAAAAIALAGIVALGAALEIAIFRPLYARGHLEQVLATFGLILFFNELVVVLWGREPLYLAVPAFLSGTVELVPGAPYPAYRLAISLVALAAGGLLWALLARTRLGMRIRAGAERRETIEALGVDIRTLYTAVFGLGAFLAGLAGLMTGPLLAIQSGSGEPILILTLVVVIIGGLGSLKGALASALLVGVLDTFGRVLLPQLLGSAAGTALASMVAYILVAGVLIVKPSGLFPART